MKISKIDFWIKTSNYSIVVCGIVLVAKLFFREYLEFIITPILIIGAIALLVYFFSESMKFILKRKK